MNNDCLDMAEKVAKYDILKALFEGGVLDIEGAESWSMLEDFLMSRPNYPYRVQRTLEEIGFYNC